VTLPPKHIHIERKEGLHVEWDDGTSTFFPSEYLRRMSPSADSKALRVELDTNPLAILPNVNKNALTINDAELVGNYAIRFVFSDGHKTGIYSWKYLKALDPPTK
jgi:DUF971 family protein